MNHTGLADVVVVSLSIVEAVADSVELFDSDVFSVLVVGVVSLLSITGIVVVSDTISVVMVAI